MIRLFVVRAVDVALDVLCLLRAIFAIAAALIWRLISLPAGPHAPRPRRMLLIAAVIIFAAVAAFCAVNAQGAVIVDVTQDQAKQVCTLGGCRIERIKARDIGVVVGQLDDGSWIALGHARKFQLGSASIDLGNGDPAVQAKVIACNSRLDLSLLSFQHGGWLPCRPLNGDPQACAWIISKLGKMPVAPARTKDVRPGQIASAEPAPEPPATFVPPVRTPAVEDVPPPRDARPASQSPTTAPAPSIDWDALVEKAAAAAQKEAKKQWAEHRQEMRNDYAQSVAAQRTAGATGVTAAKQAAIGTLKTVLPGMIKEAMSDLVPLAVSQLKAATPSLLSFFGIAAAGATGPVGIGLAIGGFLFTRIRKQLKAHANDLSIIRSHVKPKAQTGPTAKQADPSSDTPNALPPAKAPPPAASTPETAPEPPAPQETVNTSVAQVVTEIGTEAYQRMKGDLIKKNPSLANDGTIKLMDSLFTQHLSGLQPGR